MSFRKRITVDSGVLTEHEHLFSGRSLGTRWVVLRHSHLWRPPTDVFETDDAIIVLVEIAGMREANVSVSLNDRYLTVHGVRPDWAERRAYHQMEIHFGEFRTDVEVPTPIDADAIEATYGDGFLRVVLPKAKPRQIRVDE